MDTVEATAGTRSPEREVADRLSIGAEPNRAWEAMDEVPFWFHTFCLNHEHGIYTDGVAVDHRYRLPSIPESFEDMSVLDVGTFDGFYAFLAEARGAPRVLATDNEQYKEWVKARWDVKLNGGEGFKTIKGLLRSDVQYRRLDAFAHDHLAERFDFIFCFGIIHRVTDPLRLLHILGGLLDVDGEILLETYGIEDDDGAENHYLKVREPSDVYNNDEFVYWGFSSGSLNALAQHAGFSGFNLDGAHLIDGHPRVIGTMKR